MEAAGSSKTSVTFYQTVQLILYKTAVFPFTVVRTSILATTCNIFRGTYGCSLWFIMFIKLPTYDLLHLFGLFLPDVGGGCHTSEVRVWTK
jgi:hypothetical protein